MDKLKEIKISKEDILVIMPSINKDTSNADLFSACRSLIDGTVSRGLKVSNIGEVYCWAKDIRDTMKKG